MYSKCSCGVDFLIVVCSFRVENSRHQNSRCGSLRKTCLDRPLKNRQNKDINANGCLMKVESIAECSPLN